MLHRLAVVALLALQALFYALPAEAQTPTSYLLIDAASNQFHVRGYVCATTQFCPDSTSVDIFGNPLSSTAGVSNAGGTALGIQGITGGVPISVNLNTIGGASTAALQTSILTALGNPLPLPTGAATQTTLASILTTLGSPMQASGGSVGVSGTLPAFATTPTFNCGTGCYPTTQPTIGAGSTGTDSSANAVSIPSDSTFVTLATIAVNASRALVGVQNQSGATIQLVRDNGSESNQTSIFLNGPFGTWTSSTFKGRVTIYGPSGASVAAYQD